VTARATVALIGRRFCPLAGSNRFGSIRRDFVQRHVSTKHDDFSALSVCGSDKQFHFHAVAVFGFVPRSTALRFRVRGHKSLLVFIQKIFGGGESTEPWAIVPTSFSLVSEARRNETRFRARDADKRGGTFYNERPTLHQRRTL